MRQEELEGGASGCVFQVKVMLPVPSETEDAEEFSFKEAGSFKARSPDAVWAEALSSQGIQCKNRLSLSKGKIVSEGDSCPTSRFGFEHCSVARRLEGLPGAGSFSKYLFVGQVGKATTWRMEEQIYIKQSNVTEKLLSRALRAREYAVAKEAHKKAKQAAAKEAAAARAEAALLKKQQQAVEAWESRYPIDDAAVVVELRVMEAPRVKELSPYAQQSLAASAGNMALRGRSTQDCVAAAMVLAEAALEEQNMMQEEGINGESQEKGINGESQEKGDDEASPEECEEGNEGKEAMAERTMLTDMSPEELSLALDSALDNGLAKMEMDAPEMANKASLPEHAPSHAAEMFEVMAFMALFSELGLFPPLQCREFILNVSNPANDTNALAGMYVPLLQSCIEASKEAGTKVPPSWGDPQVLDTFTWPELLRRWIFCGPCAPEYGKRYPKACTAATKLGEGVGGICVGPLEHLALLRLLCDGCLDYSTLRGEIERKRSSMEQVNIAWRKKQKAWEEEDACLEAQEKGLCEACGKWKIDELIGEGNVCSDACSFRLEKKKNPHAKKPKAPTKSGKQRKPADDLCVVCREYKIDPELGDHFVCGDECSATLVEERKAAEKAEEEKPEEETKAKSTVELNDEGVNQKQDVEQEGAIAGIMSQEKEDTNNGIMKKPRKALSAYMCFFRENRDSLADAGDSKTGAAKKVAAAFKALGDTEKQPFIDVAKKDKLRFQEENKEFNMKLEERQRVRATETAEYTNEASKLSLSPGEVGMDRHMNTYWWFMGALYVQPRGSFDSNPPTWSVYGEEALPALMDSLELRGIRERALHSALTAILSMGEEAYTPLTEIVKVEPVLNGDSETEATRNALGHACQVATQLSDLLPAQSKMESWDDRSTALCTQVTEADSSDQVQCLKQLGDWLLELEAAYYVCGKPGRPPKSTSFKEKSTDEATLDEADLIVLPEEDTEMMQDSASMALEAGAMDMQEASNRPTGRSLFGSSAHRESWRLECEAATKANATARLCLSANVLLMSAMAMAVRCPATFGSVKSGEGVSSAENGSKNKKAKVASSLSPSDRQQDGSRTGLINVTQKKQSRIRIRDGKPRNGMCVVCRENEAPGATVQLTFINSNRNP